jgi:dipeptidyl aminopeptidase/acylaminoacyl peptidase
MTPTWIRMNALWLWLLATAAVAAEPFAAADLFRLEVAGDPQISPDGRTIIYVRRSYELMTDRSRGALWRLDARSGEHTPLVTGPVSAGSPRWSPDGSRLAYVAVGDDGRAQIHVRWNSDGTSARITDLPEPPEALAWAPDGRAIAFLMFTPEESPRLGSAPARPEGAKWAEGLQFITDPIYRYDGEGYLRHGYTHLYVVAADGGGVRQVTRGAYNERGPIAFTPDGRHVLLAGNRNEGRELDLQNSAILDVDLSSGDITPLTHRTGADHAPTPSPDGRQVAYIGFEDRGRSYENARLYVMDRDGSHARSLTDGLDRTVDEAAWAADGRSLVVSYADHGATHIARVSLDGHLQDLAVAPTGGELDRPYEGHGPAFSMARDGTLVFTRASGTRPADVAMLQGGRERRLTALNETLLGARALATPMPLGVKSSFDGRAIDAWLAMPPTMAQGQKAPLILEIHGGPFSHYGDVFSTDVQLYAAAGYAVLYVNPRGSTSYGDEFANLIHHDYPGHDYDDLMSAVDAAIATGRVDPQQLFVTGGSGGGVLSAWIVGKTHRFRAAAVQKPIINWAAAALTTDFYPYLTRYWFGTTPWEDPETYWKRSPLSLVGNVTTPTIVIVGDRDYRTPVSDSEQYYQALQLRHIPTALIKVPGASHGGLAARPSQSAAKASAILAWFDRWRGTSAH